MTEQDAAILSAISAAINTIAVLVSLGLVIWTSFFRKTRRDRIDELKVEMQVVLSQIQEEGRLIVAGKEDEYFQRLGDKFRKEKYKMLYRCAYDELKNEGKVQVYDSVPIGV